MVGLEKSMHHGLRLRGAAILVVERGYRWGSFNRNIDIDMDIDVEVDVDM